MVKVVDNGKKMYKVTCPHCHAVLEYEDSDWFYDDELNALCIGCPNCDKEVVVESDIPNYEWPTTFSHCWAGNEGTVVIEDKEIQNRINRLVKQLPDMMDGEFTLEASGDTMVIVFKHEDGHNVIVTRDYWEYESFR